MPTKKKRRSPLARFLYKSRYYIAITLLSVILIASVSAGIRTLQIASSTPEGGAQAAAPTENGSTEATEAPQGPSVTELIAKADALAAGYDYTGAMALLQEYPDFESVEELTAKIAEYKEADAKLVPYSKMNEITHIFFHSLVVDTSRAFDGDADQNGYNLYMATVDEFKAILEEMYQRGFVLVSPYDVAFEVTNDHGTKFSWGTIRLPEGKQPFLMSQDDLNYYSYMIGSGNGKNETPVFADSQNDGFASRLVIGEDGFPTCEYLDANGNVTYGDYDLVPILERFIQEHPDFSYHGARAVLGVTGYEGVFGYRTKPSYEAAMGTEAYQKEVEQAKAVAQCLRDHGWIIASHSYGHPAYGEIPADRVEADSDKWEATVQPIVGETDILLFPFGSDIGSWRGYAADNAKFNALYADGYRYFFNVDSNIYWAQLGETYYRGGRRNVDGVRMYHHPEMLEDLFDVSKVFDSARPTPVPTSGAGM